MNNEQQLSPSNQLPLFGRRILITAPRNYAARLSQAIIKYGGLPILMPTIETCFLSEYSKLDNTLAQIDKFDWIAFTSRNGIEAFFERMNYLGISISILENCQLCALGKDSERLLDLGVKVNLIPTESSPEGIVKELAKVPQLKSKKILLPVPQVVGIKEPNIVPRFVAGLKKIGLEVTQIPVYITKCLEQTIYEVELDLIKTRKIDVIAFSSTAEVTSFLQMVKEPADYEHSVIACFGPYTAQNAASLGLNVLICSVDYSSFTGFAQAIAQWFKHDELTITTNYL